MAVKKYSIQGYVTAEVCVEIGTWESAMSLHDCWDMIMQIFDDEKIPYNIVTGAFSYWGVRW